MSSGADAGELRLDGTGRPRRQTDKFIYEGNRMRGIAIKNLQYDDTEIVEFEYVKDGTFKDNKGNVYTDLPKFFRVLFKSTPGSGSLIMTEVWLPDNWNGMFLGTGNGGMAGAIAYSNLSQYIGEGYVVANTDLGTSRGRESGINNPDVWKDFGWRATHIMTEIGKKLLREYYGEKEQYSYFVGASTGGQQALSLAQRFPEDYDGILAGVPANNRVFLHIYFLWNHNHLTTKDGQGKFSEAEIYAITNCAVKFFQLHGDGELGDNFVSFPYLDANTVESFLSFLQTQCPTFTTEQIESLRAVYSGPVNPVTGEQIYNGMPIGAEIYGCGIMDCQGEESPHFYPFIWAFGKDYCKGDFDFAADMEKISSLLSAELDANNANLESFYAHGGKLIGYSGSADPCVPFPDAMEYYNRVCREMGGYEKTSTFFRYFLFPGKDHGNTGRGTNALWDSEENREDLLVVLRRWREEGKTPEYIAAARVKPDADKEKVVFVRKIYPYTADKNGAAFPAVCCERYLKIKK